MIPKRLFRFFKERDHAEQFISGRIRITNIEYYKSTPDDTRRDRQEGRLPFVQNEPEISHIFDTQTNEYLGEIPSLTEKKKGEMGYNNPLYLLCTSSYNAKKTMIKNGFKFMAEITDPTELLKLLQQSWGNHWLNLLSLVELNKVRYGSGDLIKTNKLFNNRLLDLSYRQKPSEHKGECEWRYIFFCDFKHWIHLDNLKDSELFELLDIVNDNNVIKREIYCL